MKAFKMSYTISSMLVLIGSITAVILFELPIYLGIFSTMVYMAGLSIYRGYHPGIVLGMILKKCETWIMLLE